MNYKQIIPLFSLLILQIWIPLFGQSWQETDFRTREGYANILQQYANDNELPLDERFAFYKTGVQAALYHQDSQSIQKFAYEVASTANALDSMGTALEYIDIARNAVDENEEFAVNIINYQGVLHKQAGDFEQALAYYEEALNLARNKFPDKMVMPLSNIATLYRSQKDFEKTLEYLRQLDRVAQGLDSLPRAYHRVFNFAEFCIVHKQLDHLDSAAYYAELCLQNLEKLDKQLNMKATGFAYITVAEFYIEKLQQPERAKPLLDSALLYTEGAYQTKVMVSLGKYYLAIDALSKAETVVRQLNEADLSSQTTRLRVLELSQEFYKRVGDFEKAIVYTDSLAALKAKRFDEANARLTAFYSAKFNNQQQEEEIQKLQYEQKVAKLKYQRRSLTFILFSLFALASLVILTQQVRQKKKFAKVLQREVETKTQDLKMVNDMLADKVDKLNTFNYTVSHDLKAPLNSAFNFLDLIKLQAHGSLDTNARQLLANMQGVLIHMKEMVEGVSLYLKADKMEMQTEVVATENVVHDLLAHLKYHYPDHLTQYTFAVQSPLPDCQADPLLFRQAMNNLLTNAIKATRFTESPLIQITGQKTDQAVALSVQDNGIGIPLQDRHRLFELFKSVHSRDRFPGTGAGLAIVKRIMDRHGGTLTAESEGPGKGARFSILFPPNS